MLEAKKPLLLILRGRIVKNFIKLTSETGRRLTKQTPKKLVLLKGGNTNF